MSIIKLCPDCEAALLAEIADLPQGEISGFYCGHNHAAAVIVSKAGKVAYAQLSGPCSDGQAQALMAEMIGELHRSAVAGAVAAGEGELRH